MSYTDTKILHEEIEACERHFADALNVSRNILHYLRNVQDARSLSLTNLIDDANNAAFKITQLFKHVSAYPDTTNGVQLTRGEVLELQDLVLRFAPGNEPECTGLSQRLICKLKLA